MFEGSRFVVRRFGVRMFSRSGLEARAGKWCSRVNESNWTRGRRIVVTDQRRNDRFVVQGLGQAYGIFIRRRVQAGAETHQHLYDVPVACGNGEHQGRYQDRTSSGEVRILYEDRAIRVLSSR